jgi:hypothetical protein
MAAQAHSASSAQTEERLRARMVEFRFEPNLRLDAMVTAEGIQVRLIEHRAPGSMVTRYAEQMKAGAVFPAIVVNDRNEVIDGNTRRLAAAKAGKETIAAYICSGLTALQARALSVELNQCHGLSMTDDELHAFVVGVVQEGQTPDAKAYARMTGVRASTLSRWVAQANFERRARHCGIPEYQVDALSQSCQAVLNAVRLTPVLVDLTALAVAAKMSATDLRRVVAETNAAASESDALALVAGEREGRRDQIRALANGFAARLTHGSRATMHVAALLKIDPKDLVDVAPGKKVEVLERLASLRDRLNEAITSARSESADTPVVLSNKRTDGDPALILSGQGAASA